jgi:hypothetical protein
MLQARRSWVQFQMRSRIFFFFFPVYLILLVAYKPGVDSASKRNEYQESSWEVKSGQQHVWLTDVGEVVSHTRPACTCLPDLSQE